MEKNINDQTPSQADIQKKVAKKLQAAKKDKKTTQKYMAEELYLSKDVISRAFHGKLSFRTAIILCKYFGISMDYLFGISEDKDAKQRQTQQLLKTIKRHISVQKSPNHSLEKVINISETLETFLEVVAESESITTMSQDLKNQWIQEAESEFLKEIDTEPERFIEYVC